MKPIFSLLLVLSVTGFASTQDKLFVVFGGYNSCGSGGPASSGMFEPMTQLLSDIKGTYSDLNLHYLVSCFDTAPPPEGRARFILSEVPGKVFSGDAARLQKEIERLVLEYNISTVFLIGHSYGGWTSMYLAERLVLPNPISGLFTVDPIAPSCGPFEVAIGAAACRRAPTDRNINLIKSRVDHWSNFYQNQDGWLHSGPISGVENSHIKYDRGPHTEIDSDDRTWQKISAEVAKVFEASGR